MCSRKTKEAIILLLDVGQNMKEVYKSGITVFQSSKNLILQIIQRKIFSNAADELGLILFNCAETKNCLGNKGGRYKNISLITEHLALPSWELLQIINNLESNENYTADWLDAIVVAIQFIQDETEIKNFINCKIVIFSNFKCSVYDDQVDKILNTLKDMKISLIVIGPDFENAENSLKKLRTPSEMLILKIIKEIQGEMNSFEFALSRLMHFQRKSVKPTPWNALFTISNKIKIPIRAFKKIAETGTVKWSFNVIDDINAFIVKEKAFVKFDEEKETEIEIQREDIIDAYQFGTTEIPFSDIDQKMMSFESGPKGLYLVGFSPSEFIPLHMLIGHGSYIVFAKQNDDVAKIILETFVQAMIDKNSVGIARKVYADNTACRIGALFPVINEECKYLVFVELPFAEDEHIYKFASLSHVTPTKEQNRAIVNFIEKLDLDETETKAEKYDITEIYDHQEQNILRCVSHKVLYPNEKLTEDSMLSYKESLKSSTDLIATCKSELKYIKDLFPTEKVIETSSKSTYRREKNKGKYSVPNNEIPNMFQNCMTSAIKNDNAQLNYSFMENFQKQKAVVETLVNGTSGNSSNLISVLKSLRHNCLINDVNIYNDWIQNLKITLFEKSYFSVWKNIANEKLGLISKLETNKSDVEVNKAEEFLKSDQSDVDSLYSLQNTESLEDLLNEI